MISLKTHVFRVCCMLTLAFSAGTQATVGQPGTLDSTFGSAGRASTVIGSGSSSAMAIALQPDGKLVLAGGCFGTSTTDICALRYNTNGTLDTSFGSGGKIIAVIAASVDASPSVAVQSDGRIVLAGHCDGVSNLDFCALRYNANGTPDTSFGSGGKVITPMFGGNDSVRAVALQPDGKIVLAGYCFNGLVDFAFCALRYNADGTPDAGFGSGGKTRNAMGFGSASATALVVQPDGKLVLAGSCIGAINTDFCALRYNVDGSLDTGFGSGGKVITAIGTGADRATAIALQPDGKLVLAGTCIGASDPDFCALRYHANGTLDASFGTGGSVVSSLSSFDNGNAILLQPDGKLILAGTCPFISNGFCALRYHGNGAVDTSFGSNGRFIPDIGDGGSGNAAVLQPDGKLVLAGSCLNGSDQHFCAARYDGGPFGYKACSLDLDGDGRILATTDSLIHARIALGITGSAVVNGITFPVEAKRKTWASIRDYLVTQCGMSLVP